MCGKLVLLVLSAGPLFAAAAIRQTAPPTLAGVVRDDPSAVLHNVTAAARTFSGDQCGQVTNANPGGDLIANPALELSPRTSYTRKSTAKGGDSIQASVGNVRLNESGFIDYRQLLGETDIECGHGDANIHPNVDALCEFKALSTDAPGFCTTFDLVAFRPFGADEFRSARFELRRSDAVDARNFFAASANYLERNRLRGALGGTIKQDESTYVDNASQLPAIAFTNKISISAMRSLSGIVHCSNPVATGMAGAPRMGGLHGWQSLYLRKGAPAVLGGIGFMSLPAESPDQVSWLTALEKRLLRVRMAEKQASVSEGRRLSMLLDASLEVPARSVCWAPLRGQAARSPC
jgi:hypothetical protein